MSKLRIFIEGKELDSLESVTVPITKQFEELSNPTVICNDYSKTVTVPLSKNNNDIFGHCYNPDRLISASSDKDTPLVGIYFDPYQKLDCRLQWGDDVFFTGYAKMLKVTNKGYEITINGELGKIFQELQKISFQKSDFESEEDIEKYWIDGSKYVNTTINRDLVYKCWNSSQDDYTLRETTDSNYDITDIIGFVPNNSFSSDFDYSTFEYYDSDEAANTQMTYEDYLNQEIYGEKTFTQRYGIEASSIVGDGLYPEQTGDWRSYNQIPFIYWNKFWQIFQKKSEEVTGYTWDYENIKDTPEYARLATTLLTRDEAITQLDMEKDKNFSIITKPSSIVHIQYDPEQNPSTIQTTITGSSEYVKNNFLDPAGGTLLLKFTPSFTLRLYNNTGYTATSLGFTVPTSSINYAYGALKIRVRYGNTKILSEFYIIDNSDAAEKLYSKYFPQANLLKVSQQVVSVPSGSYIDANFSTQPIYLKIQSDEGSHGIYIDITPYNLKSDGDHTIAPVLFFGTSDGYKYPDKTASLISSTIASSDDLIWQKTFLRSGDSFVLNDLCTLNFENLLNWCKMYRVNIYIDEIEKKLVFTQNYFDEYTITDHTDKVDKSSGFEVSPVTFDKKYIKWGYNDTETYLSKSYNNLYNLGFGEKKMSTNYTFNTDELVLFDTNTQTILYTPSYIYWNSIKTYPADVVYNIWDNLLLDTRDEDGNTISCKNMFFYPQRTTVVGDFGRYVTDDTVLMTAANTYCNIDVDSTNVPKTKTAYWVVPDLVCYTADCCIFEKPQKNYTKSEKYFDGVQTIYQKHWKNYIAERYNVQNKKVTTYIRLTPSEFINFKFNQFWKIGNQIYIVNKIYDYDITSDKPTKVDLITVQDIEAYRS